LSNERIVPLSLEEMSAFEQRGIPRVGLPLKPTYDNIQPRGADFTTGYNFNITQRKSGKEVLSSFQQLKFLSTEPITSLLISNRKYNIKALQWQFRTKDKKNPNSNDEKRIEELTAFFKRPDKDTRWDNWLSRIMEDILVYDASYLYKEKTIANKLNRLRVVSGSTIKILGTDLFTIPEAPDPAYQQVIQGQVQSQYTRDEMIYIVSNPQPDSMYGKSPVEIASFNINLLIRQEMHAINIYTNGNIPGGFLFTNQGTNPVQLARFLEAYNKTNKGDFQRIGQLIPLPDFFKSFQQISPATFDLNQMETLIKQLCAVFYVSPTALVNTNRAVAEQIHLEATGAGLETDKQLIKDLIDGIVLEDFGYDDIEFDWVISKDLQDPNYVSKNMQYLQAGVFTIDEIRAEEGLDPLPETATPPTEEAGGVPSSSSETDKSNPPRPKKKTNPQTVESPSDEVQGQVEKVWKSKEMWEVLDGVIASLDR